MSKAECRNLTVKSSTKEIADRVDNHELDSVIDLEGRGTDQPSLDASQVQPSDLRSGSPICI